MLALKKTMNSLMYNAGAPLKEANVNPEKMVFMVVK